MKSIVTVKQVLQGASAIIVVSAVFFVGATLLVFWGEHGQAFWGRMYVTRAEIGELERASVVFQKMHGTYPLSLKELAASDSERGHSKFVSSIPTNPWGGSYYLEPSANGNEPKIWTIPDDDVKRRLGVTELSNLTDWPAILHKRYNPFLR